MPTVPSRDDIIRNVFTSIFLSTPDLTHAISKHFRKQRRETLLFMSSIVAWKAIPSSGDFAATTRFLEPPSIIPIIRTRRITYVLSLYRLCAPSQRRRSRLMPHGLHTNPRSRWYLYFLCLIRLCTALETCPYMMRPTKYASACCQDTVPEATE